ncbi:major facilitator superfamily domain-containing protein [Dipodascopsis uninucleata]
MAKGSKSDDQKKAEAELDDQTNILPPRRLLVVYGSLSVVVMLSFLDQSGIGVMLPSIGRDLNAQNTITWAATSTLIANTTFQVLYGRMSDIFGRKSIYLGALLLLFVADLLCGFAKTATQLFVFRGFAGVATAGLQSLTMIIVSDIVSLRQRGKYQGILGSSVGFANITGPFLGALIVDRATWRVFYWILGPLSLVCLVSSYLIVPDKHKGGNHKEKLKKVDFIGILLSSIATIFLLVPVSSGGTSFAWNSPLVISFFCIAGVASIFFLYSQWKIATLPMMPLRLFTNKICGAMFAQVFLVGLFYFSQINLLPAYYQNVHGYSRIVSAALLVPMVAVQSVVSTCAGLYMSKTGHYGSVVYIGYSAMAIGAAIQCGVFTEHSNPGLGVLALLIQGVGTGCTFQPTLVALQANTAVTDRAVTISVRGWIRALGGAVGLAICSSLLSNILKKNIPSSLPENIKNQMANSAFAVPDLSGISDTDIEAVRHAYFVANRSVFIFFVPVTAIALFLCVLIKDTGLDRAGVNKPKAPKKKEALTPANDDSEELDNNPVENIVRGVDKDVEKATVR